VARKHLIYSYPMYASQVVDVNSVSASSSVDQLDKASIDLRWESSTLVAEAQVEARNGDNAEWRVLDFGATIDITGGSGAHELILNEMPFTDLRLAIIVTSGEGTIDAVLTSKSVGA